MANLQQQRNGKLADGECSVDRHVGHWDSPLLGKRRVNDIIPGSQHRQEAYGRARLHGTPGNGRLVGHNNVGVSDPANDLLLVRETGALINRQTAQLLKALPAQVPGIFGVTIQNHDFHKIASYRMIVCFTWFILFYFTSAGIVNFPKIPAYVLYISQRRGAVCSFPNPMLRKLQMR